MIDEYKIGDASRRAAEIVSTERDSHGDAYTNHRQIAALWTAFLDDQLDEPIEAWQAAIMMQQVKQSRMQAGQLHYDHFVDVAGYSDVAFYSALSDFDLEVVGFEPNESETPSNGEMLDDLRRVADEIDGTPNPSDVSRVGLYDPAVYYERFDSWGTTLEVAGIYEPLDRGDSDE